MTGTEVTRWHDPADREVRYALAYLRQAPNVIGSAFKKDGQVDWGAVALAAAACLDVGLSPISNLHKMPVINGQVFPEAELWRVQFLRHGGRIDILEDTDDKCSVELERDGRTARFTMTAVEARRINDAKAKPNALYKSDIRAMLRARTTMRAIRLNFPDVMAGPPGRYGDDGPEIPEELAPATRVSGASSPARATVDEATRARLAEAISGLPDPTREDLRAACREVEMVNLNSAQFNACDAALMSRLIVEAIARAELAAYTDAVDESPEAASHDADEPVEALRYTPEEEAPF